MTIQTIQWIHTRLVQPAVIEYLDGPNSFTWCSAVFPYVVPKDYWLGIVDMQVGSKFTDGGPWQRASMLVLDNVGSVPDNVGFQSFRVPLVVPPGTCLRAKLINNDAEQQWMNSAITGLLVPKLIDQTWQDAFAFLFTGR